VPNKLRLFAATAMFCLSRSATGQISEADSVKGEVHLNSPAILRGEVTLRDLHGTRFVVTTAVGGDGRFEFRNLPYGDYRLTVLDAARQPIHEELISVHQQQQPIDVEVTLREKPQQAAGTVSANDLLHPPTKKAFKAFLAGQKFAEAGTHDKAADQFEKATQLSPDYAAAWIDLAAEHIFLKRYEQALGELAHASEISQPTALILSNMAFAQYSLHRYAEGTRSAREALLLDPSCAQAHYLLGSFLLLDRRTRAEGLQHLEAAARTMPTARAELDRARHESAQVALGQ
jgi:tetratricopeptide (TPR) repeat protein